MILTVPQVSINWHATPSILWGESSWLRPPVLHRSPESVRPLILIQSAYVGLDETVQGPVP